MTERNCTINWKLPRDADLGVQIAQLVQTASRFSSSLQIRLDSKRANCKSIMGIMSLGLRNGQNVRITAEGEDEGEAAAALAGVLGE